MIFIAMKGVGTACYGVIIYSFIMDCVEYGAYKTGTKASGITFALQTFVSKMKSALIMSIALFSLSLFGFVAGENAVQPDGVAQGIWLIFNLLPSLGYIIALILLGLFYKLRDSSVQIMSKYNAGEISREEAEAQLGPKFGPAAS
jgi:Na+/melibiose symporter-like transporter